MTVRLRDVAARAGVSPRSVSNVINGFHYVSPGMRAKVQAAIDELDYQPNLLARSLRKGHTGTVGLLLPQLSVPYFAELAHHLVEQASELGLTVLVDETTGERKRELHLLEVMSRSRYVDGILLSALGLSSAELTQLQPRIPVVLLGERATGSTLDHVGINNIAAARDATQHLIETGRTRIAAIVERPHPCAPTSRLRLKGYQAALSAAGLDADPQLVARVRLQPRRQDGATAMGRLLSRPRPPDAVFCFNDLVAIGALAELHHQGVQVPEDISVVSVDDIEECRFTIPTLSSIAPDKTHLARSALQLLTSRVEGADHPPRDIRIPYHLVTRASTDARPDVTAVVTSNAGA